MSSGLRLSNRRRVGGAFRNCSTARDPPFDGVFLHRPELLSYWDLSLFLDAPFEVTIPRAARRDGSSPDVNAPENRRYVEGQQLYLRTCEPRRAATLVIDNQDLASPEIITA